MNASDVPIEVDLAHAATFDLGALVVSPATREVVGAFGHRVLEPRVMQVLVALASRRGQVVSRGDLIAACWGGRIVGEDAINRCIGAVRALGVETGAFSVTTIIRVGYRLQVPASAVIEAASPQVPAADPPLPASQSLAANEQQSARFLPSGGRPTIAVLPFEHDQEDREQSYLADGIAEDVIAALSRFKWLFVLSRHSSLNYKEPNAPIEQIRRELGVQYIVSAKLNRRDDHIRIAVNLTDCDQGDTIWSQRFEGETGEIFDIQDQITSRIVSSVEPSLIRREERGAAGPEPRSMRHWDLFIRGRWHFWRLTPGHVAKANRLLTEALALKPDDAPTLSLLAYTHFTRLWSGWSTDPDAEVALSQQLARRAVRADSDDAFAHYTFGIACALDGDLERAAGEQRRAIELNPNFAAATAEIGRYLAFSGQYDEAIEHLDQAIQSSPGDAHYFLWFRDKAIAAFTAVRYDDAIRFGREAVTLRQDIFFIHYLLAASYAAAGLLDRAKAAFKEGRRILPKYPVKVMKLGHPFVRREDFDRFLAALRQCGWNDEG